MADAPPGNLDDEFKKAYAESAKLRTDISNILDYLKGSSESASDLGDKLDHVGESFRAIVEYSDDLQDGLKQILDRSKQFSLAGIFKTKDDPAKLKKGGPSHC
jgi:hypothetical protein